MSIRKRQASREERRYTRTSTKRRLSFRPPAHPGRILAVTLCAVAVTVLALVWGYALKARSDAYHEALSENDWTVQEANGQTTAAHPVTVPDVRAVAIEAGESVGDILIAGKHGGVILALNDGDGNQHFASHIAEAAGLPNSDKAPVLSDEVSRIGGRGLYVTCTFTVTCLSETDTATAAYLRGLELALLREYAEAGMDDILLLGLPVGTDADDARTVSFLTELASLLADLPDSPAVGVALLPQAFANDESTAVAETESGGAVLYAGNITPARVRNACDYLAMDLRSLSAEAVSDLLPNIQYAYVRHSLRLLISDATATEDALSHGFERVFEMPSLAEADSSAESQP